MWQIAEDRLDWVRFGWAAALKLGQTGRSLAAPDWARWVAQEQLAHSLLSDEDISCWVR